MTAVHDTAKRFSRLPQDDEQRPATVPAAAARDHMRSLMSQGMGIQRISDVAGIRYWMLWTLLYGTPRRSGHRQPRKTLPLTVHQRLLSLDVAPAPGTACDGTGTRRRLRAMVAIGYPVTHLAHETGVRTLKRIIHGKDDEPVLRSTATRVTEVYDRLAMTPNQPIDRKGAIGAARARGTAARHGWLPPLAWDDDHIDDPQHGPPATPDATAPVVDEVAVYRRMNGDRSVRLTREETLILVEHWRRSGRPLSECERRTGLNVHRLNRNRAA